jgi:xanthine dehydrogenase small subunit
MRNAITFHLGNETRTVRDADPTMTVLEYLRGPERMTGTKEGCAEGDCGACTVVVVDRHGQHQAVNACIMFLPALDGKQLLTVEHLSAAGDPLHAVQQAMVDLHGSQCGFCTPGFVMSIYAMTAEGAPDRAAVNEALAGNLCRCTGYRPIVDSAFAACAEAPLLPPPDLPAPAKQSLALTHGTATAFAPRSVAELADVLRQHPDAVIVAGATDVGLWVTKQHQRLDKTVALDAVTDMSAVSEAGTTIQIGAAATYTQALPMLERHFPDFGALIRRIGSRQIRNRGTIGGNIANASPVGDTPPVLLALDAELVLRKGARQRTLPLEYFFTGYRKTALEPGEFIERIDVPLSRNGDAFRCYKISKRFDQDISSICAAFRLRLMDGLIADIRLCFGGMAATPLRLHNIESVLTGRPWTEATICATQDMLDSAMQPLSDMRASAAYRRIVARNLLMKFFLETARTEALTRLPPA